MTSYCYLEASDWREDNGKLFNEIKNYLDSFVTKHLNQHSLNTYLFLFEDIYNEILNKSSIYNNILINDDEVYDINYIELQQSYNYMESFIQLYKKSNNNKNYINAMRLFKITGIMIENNDLKDFEIFYEYYKIYLLLRGDDHIESLYRDYKYKTINIDQLYYSANEYYRIKCKKRRLEDNVEN